MQLSSEDGRDGFASRPCRATVSPRQCSAYRRGSGSIAVGPSRCIRGPFAGSRVVDLAPRQDVSTQREGECAFQPAAHRQHDGVSVSEVRRRTCRYHVTTFWHSIEHETTRRIAALSRRTAIQHDLDVADRRLLPQIPYLAVDASVSRRCRPATSRRRRYAAGTQMTRANASVQQEQHCHAERSLQAHVYLIAGW